MSKKLRKLRKGFLAGGVLVLLVFGLAAPPAAAGCAMGVDSAPSGSLAAPDCCTDRSCPRMAPAAPRPEAILSAPATPGPSPLVAIATVSSPTISFPVPVRQRVARDDLPGPPLRI
ncbi:MAG TPA: hypothetical protein VFS34_15555 [Thermoanaerobaculia bacterium]|nr:hypothetical protein [Thermoanaerobaculia bacterium]